MIKKLVFVGVFLLGSMSIEAMQKEEFLQLIEVFKDPATYFSLMPADLPNCILPYILNLIKSESGGTPLHLAICMGLGPLVRHLAAVSSLIDKTDKL